MNNIIIKNKISSNKQTVANKSEAVQNGQFEFLKEFVAERFNNEFPDFDFEQAWQEYNLLDDFKISENVESVGGISPEAHYVMRIVSEYFFTQAFKAMKVDLNDPNVGGYKGTPFRITKMYTGAHLNDDSELLSGRWANKPQMASFPNQHNQKLPITKKIDIVAVCSHHLAPFSTMFRDGAYATVSYIPSETVIGISKLQRIVDWVARRGHLQEDLTIMIYNEVAKAAQTESVYVRLSGLVHTCESLRGTQSKDGAFTSEYYGGDFENFDLRSQVLHTR